MYSSEQLFSIKLNNYIDLQKEEKVDDVEEKLVKYIEEDNKVDFLLNKQGKTIIIVTHDINVAQKCNKVYKIVDGKIIQKTAN